MPVRAFMQQGPSFIAGYDFNVANCHNHFAEPFKDILNGQSSLKTNKTHLVLSILSNKGVSFTAHKTRNMVIPLKFMNAGCDIILKHAKNPQQICSILDETKKELGRPIDHLQLNMHGTPASSYWEEGELDIKTHFPLNCFDSLASDATISLLSCERGVDTEIKYNLAQHIAEKTKRKVFAPKAIAFDSDFQVTKSLNSSISIQFIGTKRSPFLQNIGKCEGEDYTGIFMPRQN